MTLSARVDSITGRQAEKAAQSVGLSVSDLMRAGLHRVCDEIAQTGGLRVSPVPSIPAKPKRRKGAAL